MTDVRMHVFSWPIIVCVPIPRTLQRPRSRTEMCLYLFPCVRYPSFFFATLFIYVLAIDLLLNIENIYLIFFTIKTFQKPQTRVLFYPAWGISINYWITSINNLISYMLVIFFTSLIKSYPRKI